MPSSKGPTDNRRERMAQAIRDGDDATVTAMIREANATPDRPDPPLNERAENGAVARFLAGDERRAYIAGYGDGWNALRATPDRADLECVHCGLPKGDPSACRYYCTEPHDYAEHATPDRADGGPCHHPMENRILVGKAVGCTKCSEFIPTPDRADPTDDPNAYTVLDHPDTYRNPWATPDRADPYNTIDPIDGGRNDK